MVLRYECLQRKQNYKDNILVNLLGIPMYLLEDEKFCFSIVCERG
jgi:hypothetical protein